MALTVTYDFDVFNEAQDFAIPSGSGEVAITKLANGGFAAIAKNGADIAGTIFDAAGIATGSFSETGGSNGAIAQLDNGNIVIVSQDADSVRYKIVDSTTGAEVLATSDLGDVSSGSNPDVVAVAGGFIVTYQKDFGGGDLDIITQFVANDGTRGTSITFDATNAHDQDAHSAVLNNGNVVVTWTRVVGAETEVWYWIVNSTLTALIAGPALFDTAGTINGEVSVTALGNGFALAYQDNEYATGHDNITLATFDAAGANTNKFNVTAANIDETTPDITQTDGGFIAMAVNRSDTTFVKLIDPTTGEQLADRDVLNATPSSNPTNPVIASFAFGRTAVAYGDTVAAFAGGQEQNIVRNTVSDSLFGEGDTLTGDDFRDRMTGGDGNDTLSGGGGVDTMSGGAGNDTLQVSAGRLFLQEVYDGGSEIDTLELFGNNSYFFEFNSITVTDIEKLVFHSGGTATFASSQFVFNQVTFDSPGATKGNVSITMDGQTALDLSTLALSGQTAADRFTVTGSGIGENIVGAAMSNVINGNGGNDTMRGGASADTINGGIGDDVLDGKSGNDTMTGGTGNDNYIVNDAGDRIIEIAGSVQGTADRIFSAVNYVLLDTIHVELLTTINTNAASAINLTGNTNANTIYGNQGSNILSGRAGDDTMNGVAGKDTLVGGLGRDRMTGGADADTFDFNFASETGKTAATRDVITDFAHNATRALSDQIDLFTIDANGSASGNGAFLFLAAKGAAFTGVKGQLHWFQINPTGTAGDKTIIEGDLNGDRIADFQIELLGLKNLVAADFVL